MAQKIRDSNSKVKPFPIEENISKGTVSPLGRRVE
jgi:hypothetical protein